MVALTVNGSAAAATTLAASGKLFNTTGGTAGNTSTKVGTSTQYKQIFALGTATNQTGVASIPLPTDANWHGWMWDVTTLEGQRIAAGTWTPTIHLLASTGTTITPTVQWFKRSSGGVYTSIGSVAGSSIALTTSSQLLTFTPPSLALMDFATGDKLMMWLWVNQTAGGATNSTISVVEAISGSVAGVASEAQAVTPGYAQAPLPLSVTMAGDGILIARILPGTFVLYGSNVADGTLVTACQMADASGGIETSQTTTFTNVGGVYGEIYSQTTTGAPPAAAIPVSPTGHGWVYSPGAGTFALGNWSASIAYASSGPGLSDDLTLRLFTRTSGGIYTSIGTINAAFTSASTRSVVTFAATSMPATTFAATDLLYSDLWAHDATGVGGEVWTIYEATSASAGVASDMQITTSTFTPAGNTLALSASIAGVGLLSETLTLTATLTTALAGDGTLSGTLSLSSNISGTIAGVGTFSGTVSLRTTLSATFAGVGTMSGIYVLSTALSSTVTGRGTFSAALSLSSTGVALSAECDGRGTLIAAYTYSATNALYGYAYYAPTFYLSYATNLTRTLAGTGILSSTLSAALAMPSTPLVGVGRLSSTLSAALALPTETLTGIGTLSGTLTETTALVATLPGVGSVTGTLSTGSTTALAATIRGAGSLSGTAQLSAALSARLAGMGILTEVLTATTSLISTFAGIGTLSGTSGLSTVLAGTAAGSGTLTGTVALRTSLTVSLAGTGTLASTLSTSNTVPISVTLAGISQLSGTAHLNTALMTSLAGAGTLTPTLALTTTLSTTLAGSGTLAGTLSAQVVLSTSMTGTGILASSFFLATTLISTLNGTSTLSGTFSIQVMLSLVYAGRGTLAGTLSASIVPVRVIIPNALIFVSSGQAQVEVRSGTGEVSVPSGIAALSIE